MDTGVLWSGRNTPTTQTDLVGHGGAPHKRGDGNPGRGGGWSRGSPPGRGRPGQHSASGGKNSMGRRNAPRRSPATRQERADNATGTRHTVLPKMKT